jgi:hypothetical protein
MELVDSASFIAWAAAKGIGRSVRYPLSEQLTYLAEASTWYRYRPNTPPELVTDFVQTAVRVAAAGEGVWIFPPRGGGRWLGDYNDIWEWLPPLRMLVRRSGVPDDYVGALRLNAHELSLAGRLLAGALDADALWSLAAVPEHARCVLTSDEDGDLLGSFPHAEACQSYTQALAAAGWHEPEEPDPRVSFTDPWLTL